MSKKDHRQFQQRFQRGRFRVRREKELFLLFSQGESTEISYFRNFDNGVSVKIISQPKDPIKLVEYALRRKNEMRGEYDQTWVIFDRDESTKQECLDAYRLAKKNDIKVAYSNPCFEVWFLAHFGPLKTYGNAQECCESLDAKMKQEDKKKKQTVFSGYDKTDENLFYKLSSYQEKALKNIDSVSFNDKNFEEIVDQNPITTIGLLVNELNKYKK